MTDGSGRGGDQRFKEGSTGGGDVPRNHEEATPGPRPTLTIVRTTRRRSPGGSAVSRETSQPRGGRDPGGPHRGPVTFRDEKPMRGASGDRGAAARGNTLEGEKPRRATHRAPVQSTGARAADSRGEKNPVREDALRAVSGVRRADRFGGAARRAPPLGFPASAAGTSGRLVRQRSAAAVPRRTSATLERGRHRLRPASGRLCPPGRGTLRHPMAPAERAARIGFGSVLGSVRAASARSRDGDRCGGRRRESRGAGRVRRFGDRPRPADASTGGPASAGSTPARFAAPAQRPPGPRDGAETVSRDHPTP
jgi:hypothetical protein